MIHVADTTPYSWPFDGLRREAFALVVAGADGGWHSRSARGHEAAATIQSLGVAAREAGAPVAIVRHRSGGDPPATLTAPIGCAGWEIEAMGVDGCYGSPLEALLRRAGRSQIALAGFGFEGPVHSTLRSLNDRGLECLTLIDACAPLDPDLVAAACSTIELSGGIFGAVGRSPQLISALKEAR